MAAFQEKYTDQQRDAIRRAGLDLGISSRDIAHIAGTGQLELRGIALAPFEIPVGTVYGLIREERKRREGKDHSALVQMPHIDAVELLRRRMVALLDSETLRMEKDQKTHPKTPIDAEHARRMARALREVMAMPPPGRPGTQPGKWIPGEGKPVAEHESGPRSIKGQLAAALERGAPTTETAQDEPIPVGDTAVDSDGQNNQDPEPHNPTTTHKTNTTTHNNDNEDPGSWARDQFGGVLATHVDGERLSG